MYCSRTWVLLRLHMHTLFVRFRLIPDWLGCYFGLWNPNLQFLIAFTSSCLCSRIACMDYPSWRGHRGFMLFDNHWNSGVVIARKSISSVGVHWIIYVVISTIRLTIYLLEDRALVPLSSIRFSGLSLGTIHFSFRFHFFCRTCSRAAYFVLRERISPKK